jgi:hypothetical protein
MFIWGERAQRKFPIKLTKRGKNKNKKGCLFSSGKNKQFSFFFMGGLDVEVFDGHEKLRTICPLSSFVNCFAWYVVCPAAGCFEIMWIRV